MSLRLSIGVWRDLAQIISVCIILRTVKSMLSRISNLVKQTCFRFTDLIGRLSLKRS